MRDTSGEGGASPEIVRVPAAASDTVIDVLADAFADYPVMRFVLGPGGDPLRRLRRLVGLFVTARAMRGDPMFTAVAAGRPRGAMTMSFPPGPEAPAAFARVRDEVWEDLGADARARYDACVEAWTPLGMDVPHAHVNMLGVLAADRGQGLARLLLERAQEVARATGEAEGVHLTTENPGNLLFYKHVGYEVVGHARISSSLETWALFRPNGRRAAGDAARHGGP